MYSNNNKMSKVGIVVIAPHHSISVVCNPECGHGLCVENDTCSCDLGYKGRLCNESGICYCTACV